MGPRQAVRRRLEQCGAGGGHRVGPEGRRQERHPRQLPARLRPHQHVRAVVEHLPEHSGHQHLRGQHLFRSGGWPAERRASESATDDNPGRLPSTAGPVEHQHPGGRSETSDADDPRLGRHLPARGVCTDADRSGVRGAESPAPVWRVQRQPGGIPQQRVPGRLQNGPGRRREYADEPVAGRRYPETHRRNRVPDGPAAVYVERVPEWRRQPRGGARSAGPGRSDAAAARRIEPVFLLSVPAVPRWRERH